MPRVALEGSGRQGLHQGGEHLEEGPQQPTDQWLGAEPLGACLAAVFHVLFKDVSTLAGHVLVVEDCICLKVQVKATDIDIGGTYGTNFVVRNKGF